MKLTERCKAEVKLLFWTKCPSRTSLCRFCKWMKNGDRRKVSEMSKAGGWTRLRGRLVHPHLPTENLTALGSLHRSSEHGRDQRSPKLPSFQSHPLLSTFDIPIKHFLFYFQLLTQKISILLPPNFRFFLLKTIRIIQTKFSYQSFLPHFHANKDFVFVFVLQ